MHVDAQHDDVAQRSPAYDVPTLPSLTGSADLVEAFKALAS